MKGIRTVFLTVFFIMSVNLLEAASIDITSRTFPRFIDSNPVGDTTDFFVPTYEYLTVNLRELGIEGLSFNASGWGRLDIGVDPDDKAGDGDLLYGYLDYRDSKNYYHIRLGRQFLFSGVAQENIDGLLVDSTAPYGVTAGVFVGKPVLSKYSDISSDLLYGARLAYRIPWRVEAGVSGLFSQENSEKDRENIGIDGFARPINEVELSWRLFYSLLFKNIYEGKLTAGVTPIKDLKLALSGETTDPNARIGAGSIFSVFTERYTSIGLDAEYTFLEEITVNASYGNYQFKTDRANKFGLGVSYLTDLLGENLFGISFEQLKYNNEPTSETMTGFYEVRLFTENTFIEKIKVSLEWIHTIFDEYIYNYNGADDITLTAGYRLLKDLELLGSIYYSKNPEYTNEYQGSIFINYRFGTTL